MKQLRLRGQPTLMRARPALATQLLERVLVKDIVHHLDRLEPESILCEDDAFDGRLCYGSGDGGGVALQRADNVDESIEVSTWSPLKFFKGVSTT